MNIKFSIIVPAYNAEKFLNECIESILNQDYKNYELIIIDDGSTDNTSTIYNKYIDDKRLIILKQENKGVTFARLAGVNIATGDYLVFCDSDDMISSKMLSSLYCIINKYSPDIINFGMTNNENGYSLVNKGKFYEKKEIVEKIFPWLLEDKRGKYFPPQICCSAFKKNVYVDNQVKKKIAIGEDLACKKAAVYNSNSLYIMDDVLYFYRRNEFSATLSKKTFPWDGPKLIGEHLSEKINITLYDLEQQLNRVITHQLFLVVISQFNKKIKYKEIKKEIMDNINISYYKNAIDNCNYSIFYIKGYLAKFLLKNKLIFLIYIISKLY